jgi:hypothetical protein
MTDKADEIRVNRAPLLTLWAAIVAEHLGFDSDAAITLGRAVAGSSARAKARSIGLEEKHQDHDERDTKPSKSAAPRQTVRLLGRDVPVVEQSGSQFALDGDKAAAPGPKHGPMWRRRWASIWAPYAGQWTRWHGRCPRRS